MKKIFIKIIKITSIVVVIILIPSMITVFFTGPELPEKTDMIIEEVIESALPEMITGKADYVESDGLKIWYEYLTPKDSIKGTILLFMGIANDAMGWPPMFLDNLVKNGYQVIRYDYRSTGMSTWIEDYKEQPFSLADLAKDAVVILDSLGIDKVHAFGISLGGMVAQDFAINYPERTSSLTSMMSTGNIMDPELPGMSKSLLFQLVKIGLKYTTVETESNIIKMNLAARVLFRGDSNYDIDIKDLSQQVLYNIRERKGYNFNSSPQHQEATFKSGSRYDKLKELEIPILIMHGINDPLIPFAHSKKLSRLLPNAKTKWFTELGHDLPNSYVDSVCNELFSMIE